jgi:hypothetical protein
MHLSNFWLISPTSLQGEKRVLITITFGQLISVLQHYYHKKKKRYFIESISLKNSTNLIIGMNLHKQVININIENSR